MKICFSCGKTLDISGKPGRGAECPFCGADIKVCVNCRFFNENSYNNCDEPSADRVLDKTKRNYCEFFEFRERNGSNSAQDDPLAKLKDLFKS